MQGTAQKIGQKYHKSPIYRVLFLLFRLEVIWAAPQEEPASKFSVCIVVAILVCFIWRRTTKIRTSQN